MPWVKYDPTYPLTKPKSNIVDHRTVYKIAVIADPDQASVRDGTKKLFSELLTGLDLFGLWWVRLWTVIISNLNLISRIYGESIKGTLSLQGDKVEVIFGNDSIELESDYSFSGRGMELSVTGLLVVTKCVGDNHWKILYLVTKHQNFLSPKAWCQQHECCHFLAMKKPSLRYSSLWWCSNNRWR